MSLRLRRWAALPAVVFLFLGVFAVLNARAATVANFAIDGRIQRQAAPDDWAAGPGGAGLIQQTRNGSTCTAPPAGVAAVLICDPVKSDGTTFPGGAKEPDTAGWIPLQASQVTPKTDINNVYALGRVDPTSGHPTILNGMERLPKSGDVHLDFEFNQQTTGTGLSTIPVRQVGDLLIAYDLGGSVSTNLGSLQIRVFQAKAGLGCGGSCAGFDYDHPDSGASGSGLPVTGTGVVGTMNTSTINSGPWKSYDDHYKLIDTIDAFGFGEASIDLHDAVAADKVCLNFVTVKSRSSESVTSQLKDTTGTQPFPFCGGLKIHKFIDVNANGTSDAGDPAGQWDFTVTGPNGSNNVVCSGTTDATTGDLSCPNLLPGDYVVTETQKSGWTATNPAGGTSKTVTVSLGATANVSFGNTCYVEKTFTVTNVPSGYTPYAWYKKNGGAKVTVALTVSSGTASGKAAANAFTAADTIDWGWGITSPAQEKTVQTGEKMSDGAYPKCALTNTDAFPRVTLAGTKYKDANNDGNGAGETGPSTAFTFRLKRTDVSGVADRTATQGIDSANAATFGKYSFANVTPGDYTVAEDSQTGWKQTEPANNGTRTVTVTISDSGTKTIGAFGNTPLSDIGVTFKPQTNPAATKSTIDCGAQGSSTSGTLSATNLPVGVYNCKVTIVDP